jgi:hypothetical protein
MTTHPPTLWPAHLESSSVALYFAGIWFFAIRAFVKPESTSNWRIPSIALFPCLLASPLRLVDDANRTVGS